jgi:hypothetical protein
MLIKSLLTSLFQREGYLPLYQEGSGVYPPLWKRGVRGDFLIRREL